MWGSDWGYSQHKDHEYNLVTLRISTIHFIILQQPSLDALNMLSSLTCVLCTTSVIKQCD